MLKTSLNDKKYSSLIKKLKKSIRKSIRKSRKPCKYDVNQYGCCNKKPSVKKTIRCLESSKRRSSPCKYGEDVNGCCNKKPTQKYIKKCRRSRDLASNKYIIKKIIKSMRKSRKPCNMKSQRNRKLNQNKNLVKNIIKSKRKSRKPPCNNKNNSANFETDVSYYQRMKNKYFNSSSKLPSSLDKEEQIKYVNLLMNLDYDHIELEIFTDQYKSLITYLFNIINKTKNKNIDKIILDIGDMSLEKDGKMPIKMNEKIFQNIKKAGSNTRKLIFLLGAFCKKNNKLKIRNLYELYNNNWKNYNKDKKMVFFPSIYKDISEKIISLTQDPVIIYTDFDGTITGMTGNASIKASNKYKNSRLYYGNIKNKSKYYKKIENTNQNISKEAVEFLKWAVRQDYITINIFSRTSIEYVNFLLEHNGIDTKKIVIQQILLKDMSELIKIPEYTASNTSIIILNDNKDELDKLVTNANTELNKIDITDRIRKNIKIIYEKSVESLYFPIVWVTLKDIIKNSKIYKITKDQFIDIIEKYLNIVNNVLKINCSLDRNSEIQPYNSKDSYNEYYDFKIKNDENNVLQELFDNNVLDNIGISPSDKIKWKIDKNKLIVTYITPIEINAKTF